MIKIRKSTEIRKITEDEFKRQKTSPEFAPLRQAAKSCNFLLIFGGSPRVFSEEALELTWTEKQIDDYILENHCEPEVERAKKIYRNDDPVKQKYIAVASRIRDNFFKAYPGLMERIKSEQEYATTHGYLRSPFGASRNFIELLLAGEYDEKEMSGIMHSLRNTTSNYYCQQVEGAFTKRNMYDLQCWLIETNKKSFIFDEVHDSVDLYIYKPEAQEVLDKAKEL